MAFFESLFSACHDVTQRLRCIWMERPVALFFSAFNMIPAHNRRHDDFGQLPKYVTNQFGVPLAFVPGVNDQRQKSPIRTHRPL